MITSLGISTIIRSKKKKNSSYTITNISIKDLSKIIKEFEDLPYEGYVHKRSKDGPNDSYFYLARQLAKCMTRFNMCVGPVRTQTTNTQNMNNYEMNAQKIPTLHVCLLDDSESKRINADERSLHVYFTDKRKQKRVIINACS